MSDILESAVPIVMEHCDSFALEICCEQVKVTVVIGITRISTHAGPSDSIGVEGYTCLYGSLFKSTLAKIMKEQILESVIRHKHIRKSIIVVISYSDPEPLPCRGKHTHVLRLIADVPLPMLR